MQRIEIMNSVRAFRAYFSVFWPGIERFPVQFPVFSPDQGTSREIAAGAGVCEGDRAGGRVGDPALRTRGGYSAAIAIGGSLRATRSKRSRFITLVQASTKSFANFSFASAQP